jgi:hypothetical protein
MLDDLTHIPRIMRGNGWLNGARLLDIWFSRPAAVAPHYSNPDTMTIKMDAWVLTFVRAKKVYDKMMSDRVWANAAAQQTVSDMIKRQGLVGSTPRTFGNLGGAVAIQDRDYINILAIDEGLDFDDMTAALGAFVLRVVVSGVVAPSAGGRGHVVTINEVGVYVRDSFDFEGDQYLGCWSDSPDGFLPLMPPEPGGEFGFSLVPPRFSPVGNRDFREWRTRNRRGGDFLVFSDLKRTTLSTPDQFALR